MAEALPCSQSPRVRERLSHGSPAMPWAAVLGHGWGGLPVIPHSDLTAALFWLFSGNFSSQAPLKHISVALGKHFQAEVECMSYARGLVALSSELILPSWERMWAIRRAEGSRKLRGAACEAAPMQIYQPLPQELHDCMRL